MNELLTPTNVLLIILIVQVLFFYLQFNYAVNLFLARMNAEERKRAANERRYVNGVKVG